MIGTALLSTMILVTVGGFFACWPAAMVYRFFSGRIPPGAPPESGPWSVSDVLWVAAYRLATGRFLPWTARRRVPWTFLDLLIVIFVATSLLVGIFTAVQGLRVAPANGPVKHHIAAIADSLWKISAMAVAMLYLVAKSGATWRDFGLSWRDLGGQVAIGIMAFVMLAPPVYAIQAAIVWYGKWKYEHPLIEMLQKSPDLGLFLLLAISACVMAPLSEEWLFRGILQAWLERAFGWLTKALYFQHSTLATVAGGPPAGVFEASTADAGFAAAAVPGARDLPPYPATHFDPNPYSASQPAPSLQPSIEEAIHEEPFPRNILAQWLPILISAVLFGLAHWGHGPAPIPLTILAIGLGYVYQRTHSIVPVMVVHALFNSVSMLLFYVYMFELEKPLP